MIIALEGIIGAGKTHFLEVIRKNFSNVKIFTEGIDKDIYKQSVKDYYTEPHKYAYPFQLTMLWRKMSDGLDAQEYDEQTEGNGIALIERTISSNNRVFCRIAYEKGYITDQYLRLYNHSYDKLKRALKQPDAIIYLRCPVEFAFKNISDRKRAGEELIPIEYLSKLDGLYEEWVRNYKGKIYDIYFYSFMPEEKICNIFSGVLSQCERRRERERQNKDDEYISVVSQLQTLKQQYKEFNKELKGERF